VRTGIKHETSRDWLHPCNWVAEASLAFASHKTLQQRRAPDSTIITFPHSAKTMKLHIPIIYWPVVLVACCWQLSIVKACTPPLVLKGKKFFNSETGEYFPVKGINYYPRPNAGELGTGGSRDYFTEEMRPIWERDVEHFKALGVNAIRLYAVDPSQNHEAFMCALQEAGIYVMIGLAASCENCAITEDETPACYPADLKTRGQDIINTFSKYPNVMAFDAGNEINLVAPTQMPEWNAACQKQFIRDMRAYISGCGETVMRQIPVGLVTADVERSENALYYGCQTVPGDELETTQWYGTNTYVHCDGSATSIDQLTGYQNLLSDFGSYGLSYPVILTEFGCLNEGFPTLIGDDGISYEAQRTWLQVEALFDPQYEVEFNGGFVFEFSTEKVYSESTSDWPFNTYGPGNYGVGYYEPVDCDDETIPCSYVRFPQFDLLAQKYAAANGTTGRPTLDSYTPGAVSIPACPANFPALDQFTWPSASVEDRVCWDDGGFQCPSCGGAPLGSSGGGSATASPAPAAATPSTAVPGTGTSPKPSSTMDMNVPTSPSASLGNSTPSPASSTRATKGPTTPSLTSAPIDLEDLPDSFLETSGACRLPRVVAVCSTLCILVGLCFY
jgi:hypothetical protein